MPSLTNLIPECLEDTEKEATQKRRVVVVVVHGGGLEEKQKKNDQKSSSSPIPPDLTPNLWLIYIFYTNGIF